VPNWKLVLLSIIVIAVAAFASTAALAGPSFLTAYGQTHCIDGAGNGSTWDWELRPEGGGAPFCSGTESFSGTEADLAEHFRAAIDGCASDIRAYPSATLGFSCPAGTTDFTVARELDTTNWELAIEDSTNPPNLKVATAADPVSFNPDDHPPVGNEKPVPCNGSNVCCDGGTPPCNPVPEPGTLASLLSGSIILFGLKRLRRR